jgi:hypothetical protein
LNSSENQGQFLGRFTGLQRWQNPVISFSLAGVSRNSATPQLSKPQLNGSIFNLMKRSEAMSENLNEIAAEKQCLCCGSYDGDPYAILSNGYCIPCDEDARISWLETLNQRTSLQDLAQSFCCRMASLLRSGKGIAR